MTLCGTKSGLVDVFQSALKNSSLLSSPLSWLSDSMKTSASVSASLSPVTFFSTLLSKPSLISKEKCPPTLSQNHHYIYTSNAQGTEERSQTGRTSWLTLISKSLNYSSMTVMSMLGPKTTFSGQRHLIQKFSSVYSDVSKSTLLKYTKTVTRR